MQHSSFAPEEALFAIPKLAPDTFLNFLTNFYCKFAVTQSVSGLGGRVVNYLPSDGSNGENTTDRVHVTSTALYVVQVLPQVGPSLQNVLGLARPEAVDMVQDSAFDGYVHSVATAKVEAYNMSKWISLSHLISYRGQCSRLPG